MDSSINFQLIVKKYYERKVEMIFCKYSLAEKDFSKEKRGPSPSILKTAITFLSLVVLFYFGTSLHDE